MKTNLNRTITNDKEAVEFLIELYNNGESFHPEDNAMDVVWHGLPYEDQPTEPECKLLNSLMTQIYIECKIDPCGVLLTLTNEEEGEKWLKSLYNIAEKQVKSRDHSHVETQVLAQTGGWCMVDYFMLKDGSTMGVTDEGVGLSWQDYNNDSCYEPELDIGFVDICGYGLDFNQIKYPEPTAYHRTVEEGKKPTGWYIASHVVKSDDGIVFYDAITMRNNLYIVIDDAQITIFEDNTEANVIGIIERPCAVIGSFDRNGDTC